MKRQIRITAGAVTALAELNGTATAAAIWDALPFSGEASTWGHEVYFSIPVTIGAEDGRQVVGRGELGYWPTGNAFCIFFGRTPASRGDEIRAASEVNVFGRLVGDPEQFETVRDGDAVTVERAEHKS